MPTSLTLEQHLETIDTAGSDLARWARTAGLVAPVPTCPDWTVRDLVVHQAWVHRWAVSHVSGAPEDDRETVIHDQESDLIGYYDEGLALLLAALRSAPTDLDAMTFLADALGHANFGRQAHETTIHAVDSLASVLGRVPDATETHVGRQLAVDGIDEILRGYFTRGRSKLYDGEKLRFVVAPTDSSRRWYVDVAERMTVTDSGPDAQVMTGTATRLYLGLWNRSSEIEGPAVLLARWRRVQRIG